MELVNPILNYLVVGFVLLLGGWFFIVLLKNALSPSKRSLRSVEKVSIVEGGSIVEQQRYGRERNRQVIVEIPSRPLCYEEQLNLRSILDSGNENVKVVSRSDK